MHSGDVTAAPSSRNLVKDSYQGLLKLIIPFTTATITHSGVIPSSGGEGGHGRKQISARTQSRLHLRKQEGNRGPIRVRLIDNGGVQ